MKAQQRKLNSFVREYNQVRPHEALGMETPAKVHKHSHRPFPERIKPWEYPSNMKVIKVTKNGSARWGAYWWVYVSGSLAGKHIGIEEIGNGIWKVWYRNVFLGYFNEKDIRDKEKSVRLSTNLV
jgi:hypothetical protein